MQLARRYIFRAANAVCTSLTRASLRVFAQGWYREQRSFVLYDSRLLNKYRLRAACHAPVRLLFDDAARFCWLVL